MINAIISGLIIGIIISAPMGPIGILCVQRTLNKGKSHGFFTGLGAAFSDILYATLVAFFMTFITGFIVDNQTSIQIFGAIFIFFFGIHIFKSKPQDNAIYKKVSKTKTSYLSDFISGFMLCLCNPLIIFFFIGLFAKFNAFPYNNTILLSSITLFSIFIGAIIWWAILALIIGKLRKHFNLKTLSAINKFTGTILVIIALIGITTGFLGVRL